MNPQTFRTHLTRRISVFNIRMLTLVYLAGLGLCGLGLFKVFHQPGNVVSIAARSLQTSVPLACIGSSMIVFVQRVFIDLKVPRPTIAFHAIENTLTFDYARCFVLAADWWDLDCFIYASLRHYSLSLVSMLCIIIGPFTENEFLRKPVEAAYIYIGAIRNSRTGNRTRI